MSDKGTRSGRRVFSAASAILLSLACASLAAAEPARSPDLDAVLQELESYALTIWDPAKVPGFAYAVVQGSETVYARGFGTRSQDPSSGPVGEHTLFEIGSCTKAFNAAVLGTVVDEGKVAWGDKVRTHLPDFKMYDKWVTEEFLVEDLMAQRPGMPGYALDSMAMMGYGRADIRRAIRFVEPVTSFRSSFAYQNNLHLWVSELVEKKTGLVWEEAVRQRLLAPLGMADSTFDFAAYDSSPDHAMGHMVLGDGSLWKIPPDWPYRGWVTTYAPAGALCSNVSDMAKWASFQLGDGTHGGTVILKPETIQAIRAPRIYMAGGPTGVVSYAMGWAFQSSPQTPYYWHNGETVGMHSIVAFYPECNLGLVVLTNAADNKLPENMARRLPELYFGAQALDCPPGEVASFSDLRKGVCTAAAAPESAEAIPQGKLVGTYKNPAYGKAVVKKSAGGLTLAIGKTPVTGPLAQTAANQYRFDWPDWPGVYSTLTFKADASGEVTKLTIAELADVSGGVFKKMGD